MDGIILVYGEEARPPDRGWLVAWLGWIIRLLLIVALCVLLYAAFRGYLAPTFLLDFANNLLC